MSILYEMPIWTIYVHSINVQSTSHLLVRTSFPGELPKQRCIHLIEQVYADHWIRYGKYQWSCGNAPITSIFLASRDSWAVSSMVRKTYVQCLTLRWVVSARSIHQRGCHGSNPRILEAHKVSSCASCPILRKLFCRWTWYASILLNFNSSHFHLKGSMLCNLPSSYPFLLISEKLFS